MDASKKLNSEALKTYLTKHLTLTSAQNTAAMSAFDSCIKSPNSGPAALSESVSTFKCMGESLAKNVSSH